MGFFTKRRCTALLAGAVLPMLLAFCNGGGNFWWTAADEDADDAYLRKMAYDNEDMREFIRDKNLEGFSVRCVRDG